MESQQSPVNSRRNKRLRLACSRCQKRKIRCDGQYPACNNCKKASVLCTDGDSLRIRDLANGDEEVTSLKNRIVALEAALAERDRLLVERNDSERTTQLPEPAPPPAALQGPAAPAAGNDNALSHEIGLVSVGNSTAPRYIGPSSGYFLSRILFGSAPFATRQGGAHRSYLAGESGRDGWLPKSRSGLAADLLDTARSRSPLPDKERAKQLANAFFDTTAAQYPILFRPAFMRSLEDLFTSRPDDSGNDQPSDTTLFQVYMVLAIGATVLSHQLNIALPAEVYCMSALEYFEGLNMENTIPGLQCILLLLVFGIHNPHMRLNVWYLNYHCIAALLDLGLQRDITTRRGISKLEQEMRTRLFWVIFSLDRTISTIMGRPIGLREEACEFRYPQPSDSGMFLPGTSEPATLRDVGETSTESSYMVYALHLFKLSRLNSEIKYVANSVVRGTPRYAYPPPTDIQQWQQDMASKLDEWEQNIPKGANGGDSYWETICHIRYHSLVMLLMRPTPAITFPTVAALERCYKSSQASILLYDSLYRENKLVYGWTSFHGILLSIVTMLYCIRASPNLASDCLPETIMSSVYKGLNILSAAGEYWPGAKRSRNVLDDLLQDIIGWMRGLKRGGNRPQNTSGISYDSSTDTTNAVAPGPIVVAAATEQVQGDIGGLTSLSGQQHADGGFDDSIAMSDITYMHQDDSDMGRGGDWDADLFAGQWSLVDPANMNTLMHSYFAEFSFPGDEMS